MPYSHKGFTIPDTKDKRRKISDADKILIKSLYPKESLRSLGKRFGVDKKTISRIVNPQVIETERAYQKGRWALYYDKDKHKDYVRVHRRYKQKLIRNNQCEVKNDK